jgi:hypothetical protein
MDPIFFITIEFSKLLVCRLAPNFHLVERTGSSYCQLVRRTERRKKDGDLRLHAHSLASPSPFSLRLCRPAAQRNLWSRLASARDRWLAAADQGHSHAAVLVNTHLSLR